MNFATLIIAFINFFTKTSHINVDFMNSTGSVIGFIAKVPAVLPADAEAFISALVVKAGLPAGSFTLTVLERAKPSLTVYHMRCRLMINRKTMTTVTGKDMMEVTALADVA